MSTQHGKNLEEAMRVIQSAQWRKLTEMSRQRFDELFIGIEDGSLLGKWPGGKEPKTKAQRVEARQIRMLGVIQDSKQCSLIKIRALKWTTLTLWTDGKTLRLTAE